MKEKTLCLIKPDAYERQLVGKIITMIEKNGFAIKAISFLKLSKNEAEQFYYIHKNKKFFNGLVKYMSSGYTVCMVLEKANAVEELRNLMGNTTPLKAKKGTIRNKFGIDIRHNSIHGSDSIANAKKEITFFFKGVI
jgi:nucleoside-diphosphate kinase